jgi:hypothetical protein
MSTITKETLVNSLFAPTQIEQPALKVPTTLDELLAQEVRQGDVLLIGVGPVGTLKPSVLDGNSMLASENGVIAIAVGLQSHTVAAKDVQVYKAFTFPAKTTAVLEAILGDDAKALVRTDDRLVRVLNTTTLEHEHHGTHVLAPGDYIHRPQTEQTYRGLQQVGD